MSEKGVADLSIPWYTGICTGKSPLQKWLEEAMLFMNRKVRENYGQLALQTGLQLDEEDGCLYGQVNGFQVTAYAQNPSYPYLLTLAMSAQRPDGPLTKEEIKQFQGAHKQVAALNQKGFFITSTLKNTLTGRQEVLQERFSNALQDLTQFLRNLGFQNSCQACGAKGDTLACYVSGGYLQLCSQCFSSIQQNKTLMQAQLGQRRENPIGGFVGALLGTLIGVVCIILLSQLGYVAAISGVIMAVCALKGYELLGGKLSKKGIVISLILMLVMTFVGDRIDWAIIVSRGLELDLISSFRSISLLMEERIIEPSSYWGNLILLYLFLLLGAIPTIISTLKNAQNQGKIYRLGQSHNISSGI